MKTRKPPRPAYFEWIDEARRRLAEETKGMTPHERRAFTRRRAKARLKRIGMEHLLLPREKRKLPKTARRKAS